MPAGEQPMVYTNVPLVPGPAGFTGPPGTYGGAEFASPPMAQPVYDQFGNILRKLPVETVLRLTYVVFGVACSRS